MAYMPKLDGLRAVAVALVLLQHFAPAPLSDLGTGGIGVRIFFVLSGFLITGILVDYRVSLGVGRAAAQFYWRRFLRLSPPLWLAIAAAAALGLGNMRADWWLHALYLSNLLVVARNGFGPVGHFWTLAVEEQFYILWFAVVVIAPRRALAPAIVACLLIGPAYRAWLHLAGFNNFPQVLLPGNIDSLAAGAALAVFRPSRTSWAWWALASGAVGTAALGGLADTDGLRRVIYPDAINLASLGLVALCASPGRALGWLSWPAARHVGQISYGVYVYHYFLPLAAAAYLPALAAKPAGVTFWVYVAASLAVAEVSWQAVERPLKRLRSLPPGRVPA